MMKFELNEDGGNMTTDITGPELDALFGGLAKSIPKKNGIFWNAFSSTRNKITVHKFDMDSASDSSKVGEWHFSEISEAIAFLQGVKAAQ